MKIKIPVLILLKLFIYDTAFTQNKGDKIFDPTFLHELRITSDTEPDLYNLMESQIQLTNRPYHLTTMEFDGEVIDSIGIRVRGLSSTAGEHIPMKIDINQFVQNQRFDGIKKLNLVNRYTDEHHQRNRLSYELFRNAGIAAPRTSYVEVYINDEFIDVYLLSQQIDNIFIKDHFSDEGSLAKFGFDIGQSSFALNLKYGDDVFETFLGSSTNRLDLVDHRNYFKFIAINHILNSFDNFPENNFYVFYSEKENIFHFLPWDYNYILQPDITAFLSLEPELDTELIWNNPTMKNAYLEVACELYNYLLNDAYLDNLMQNNQSIIESNMQGATVSDYNGLKLLLMDRISWLQNQLIAEGYNCGDFSYPHQTGDLVINEFVAKSDSIGGIQEPDGGTPDWIELYNNTDEDIVLNHHYYLSDDIHFPKKWNFQEPVIIPANGYQIIWADRDVHQQGVHSNFKVEKSGGDLMLVYEDMTIIDQVSYTEQELNKGYARVPNGTGDFVIQNHTFNGDNTTGTTSTDKINYNNLRLYPNPTTGKVYFTSDNEVSEVSLHDSMGQLLKILTLKNNQISLSEMPKGIYFLYVKTEVGMSVHKIVNQ